MRFSRLLHLLRSSIRERGFSLTFDWTNALHFAVANGCGETVDQFFHVLDNVRTSGRLVELPEPEHQQVLTALETTSDLVNRHVPLVVGVRFDPSWFNEARVASFLDRGCFKGYSEIPGSDRTDMYRGSYDGKFILHGEELPSIRDIPPAAIVTLTEIDWVSSLGTLLDRVWSGHT